MQFEQTPVLVTGASRALRSVSHRSRDTTGWFALIDSRVEVFMVCSQA